MFVLRNQKAIFFGWVRIKISVSILFVNSSKFHKSLSYFLCVIGSMEQKEPFGFSISFRIGEKHIISWILRKKNTTIFNKFEWVQKIEM